MRQEIITPEYARLLLWQKGNLEYKLDKNQVELRKLYQTAKEKIIVWSLARQVGKTFTLCTIAIEECLKSPNIIVKFLAPTQKMVKVIVKPIMRQLLQDCPAELRPEYKVADGMYIFQNGSEIHVVGSDAGRAESVRGSKAHLVLVDECGFISDLEYVIKSILLPTTTTTKGKIVLASTPPKSPDHPFVKFANEAREYDAFIHKTVYDNPRLTKEDIDEFAKAVGGYESIDFKREYLAQFLVDHNYAVVPEFAEKKDIIVREHVKPAYFDAYVSMDVGLRDLTAVLFGYYDFKNDLLVIDDEFFINGQQFTTNALAEGIRAKEASCYTDEISGEQREPYMRVSDTSLTVLADLQQLHGLSFIPTRKDDAGAALNELRMRIQEEKIVINPRCKVLIRHLEQATWNKNRTSYERSAINFHYDFLDSAKYMIRNVQWGKNPFPRGWGKGSSENLYKRFPDSRIENENIYRAMFNLKKRG